MADIRLRDLSNDYMKKIAQAGKIMRIKQDPRSKGKNNTPTILLAMVDQFFVLHKSIHQLSKRNSELHKELSKYHEKEGRAKDILAIAHRSTVAYAKTMQNALKAYGQKRSKKKAPARRSAKGRQQSGPIKKRKK